MPEEGPNRDYDTLRPTYPAEEHSLPFRTIFQEYRARRKSDIEAAIANHVPLGLASLSAARSEYLWAELDSYLATTEDAYSVLAATKEVVQSKYMRRESGEADADFSERMKLGYKEILKAEEDCKKYDLPLKRVLHEMQGTAVCLSGGGIRSASFSLGVLQGLARFSRRQAGSSAQKPLLKALDYLSTVSGGGYIGSWLMAWAKRSGSYEEVVDQLASPAGTSGDPEPQPVRHLREYTNYLSPRLGFTLDTVTLLSIVIRNMALNWLIIVPVVICAFCLPQILWAVSYGLPLASVWSNGDWSPRVMKLASVCVFFAAVCIAKGTWWPAYSSEVRNPGKHGSTVEQFLWFAVPMVFGGWLLGETWLRRGVILFAERTHSFPEFARWYFWFAFIPPLVLSVMRLKVLIYEAAEWKGEKDAVSHEFSPDGYSGWFQRAWLAISELIDWVRRLRFVKAEAIRKNELKPTIFHKDDGSGRLLWLRLIWALIAPMVVAVLTAMLLAGLAIGVSHLLAVPGDLVKPNYSLTWFPHLAAPDPASQVMATKIFVVLGLPVILLVLMLSGVFLSGLLSQVEREQEREWWARGGALLLVIILIWIGLNAVVFFAQDIVKFVSVSVLAALGFCTGYVGSLAGLSAVTTSGLKRVKVEQLTKGKRWLAEHNAVASVASAISLVCIALTLASFTIWLCGKANALSAVVLNFLQAHPVRAPHFLSSMIGTWQWENLPVKPTPDLRIELISALIVFAGAAALATFANLLVNVNTFSLHGLYRMRLTRAFLGASNFARHPDAFTNFDHNDDVLEAQMPCAPRDDHADVSDAAPIHVINAALNVVATRNLAWQQRKAESFTFTPVSCGSWRLGYVRTDQYGDSCGLSLGTAMAISGAAFNPNMGHNSSPLVTFLMTFFNARLGWWLPNPLWPELKEARLGRKRRQDLLKINMTLESLEREPEGKPPEKWHPVWTSRQFNEEVANKKDVFAHRFLRKSGPSLALMPLINEALGNTDDTYKWVELSDGGHFENLGLYEMVMRRCHSIIVVDCDADYDFHFEDLGNAIRKIKIDLGIPITFEGYLTGLPMSNDPKECTVYCLEGTIRYSELDRSGEGGRNLDGKLIYVKPVLIGSEPPDVSAYQRAHPKFPHESTANQFFNEAQFESYRKLGSWATATITQEYAEPIPPGCDMDTFMKAARDYCAKHGDLSTANKRRRSRRIERFGPPRSVLI